MLGIFFLLKKNATKENDKMFPQICNHKKFPFIFNKFFYDKEIKYFLHLIFTFLKIIFLKNKITSRKECETSIEFQQYLKFYNNIEIHFLVNVSI